MAVRQKKPKVAEDAPMELSELPPEQIAVRAYEIYESGVGGEPLENWLRAEHELLAASSAAPAG